MAKKKKAVETMEIGDVSYTLEDLVAIATEMNKVMGLEPAIDTDETDMEVLVEDMQANATSEDEGVEAGDEFSDAAWALFEAWGVERAEEEEKPKSKGKGKKAPAKAEPEDDEEDDEDEAPKPKSKGKGKPAPKDEDDEEDDEAPKSKKSAASKGKAKPKAEPEDDDDDDEAPKAKAKGKGKPAPAEKPKSKGRPGGPNADRPKTKFGHLAGTQAGDIDEMLLEGLDRDTIIKKLAKKADKDKTWAGKRLDGHVAHLEKDKGLNIKYSEKKGAYIIK